MHLRLIMCWTAKIDCIFHGCFASCYTVLAHDLGSPSDGLEDVTMSPMSGLILRPPSFAMWPRMD